jgi:hypothetical protein
LSNLDEDIYDWESSSDSLIVDQNNSIEYEEISYDNWYSNTIDTDFDLDSEGIDSLSLSSGMGASSLFVDSEVEDSLEIVQKMVLNIQIPLR